MHNAARRAAKFLNLHCFDGQNIIDRTINNDVHNPISGLQKDIIHNANPRIMQDRALIPVCCGPREWGEGGGTSYASVGLASKTALPSRRIFVRGGPSPAGRR